MPGLDGAWYRLFTSMGGDRRRWPELVIVLALLGLAAGGALGIWHDELRALWRGDPIAPPVEEHAGALL